MAVCVSIVLTFLVLLWEVFDYSSEVLSEEVALFPFLYEICHCVTGLAFCIFAGKKFAVGFGAIAQGFIISKLVLC